ncbi:hypothetical protein PSPO01_10564, partial [Paraphaeosphaeria sporulosa]
ASFGGGDRPSSVLSQRHCPEHSAHPPRTRNTTVQLLMHPTQSPDVTSAAPSIRHQLHSQPPPALREVLLHTVQLYAAPQYRAAHQLVLSGSGRVASQSISSSGADREFVVRRSSFVVRREAQRVLTATQDDNV